MGCKRYDGCIICVLFKISWQLLTQIVKSIILSDSLLGNKLYFRGQNTYVLYFCSKKKSGHEEGSTVAQ